MSPKCSRAGRSEATGCVPTLLELKVNVPGTIWLVAVSLAVRVSNGIVVSSGIGEGLAITWYCRPCTWNCVWASGNDADCASTVWLPAVTLM